MTFPIMPIGAALGALSQSPLDNPIAGIAGGIIGYYAASKIDIRTPVKPYAQIIKSLKVTGQSNVNYNTALMDKLNAFSKLFAEKGGDGDFLDKMNIRLENLEKMYTHKYNAPLFAAADIVDGNEYQTVQNRFNTAISKLSTVSSNSTQKSLLSAFGSESILHTVANVPYAQMGGVARRGVGRLNIDADTQTVDKLAAIKSHITSQLGHGLGEEEASRIIKSLTPAIEGMPNMKIQLDDHLSLIDPTGKKYKFPIQYLDDSGIRYGYSGNTPMASNSWNPLGSLYLNKQDVPDSLKHFLPHTDSKASADDVLRKFQPIEMLATFNKDKNHGEQLNRFASYMGTMFHNAGNFPTDLMDPMAMQISALTNINFPYVKSPYDGTGSIQQIGRTASAQGQASEFDRLMLSLGKHSTNGNPMSLNSNNDIVSVSEVKAYDPSIAADHSRRYETVTNRGFIMTDRHKAVIKKYTGLEYEGKNMAALSGFGNAQERSTLLVDDALSLAVSHIFGDKYTIDDGAGLFTFQNSFNDDKMINIDFPNIGTADAPKYNISEDMMEALRLKNGIIDPTQPLGINNIGEMMHLGKEYTNAQVVSSNIYKDYLRVSLKAKYVPDDWVKIFSEVAKSGQTMFGEDAMHSWRNAKMLYKMQRIKDAGLLDVMQNSNSLLLQFKIPYKNKRGYHELNVEHLQYDSDIFLRNLNSENAWFDTAKYIDKAYEREFGKGDVDAPQIILNRRDAGYKFVDDALMRVDPETGQARIVTLSGVKDAYMDQLFVENKAGRSAFINLIDRLETTKPTGYQDDIDFMHQYTQSGGYKVISQGGDDAKLDFRNRMASIVDKSFTNLGDFTNVKVLASHDLGPAIRGAGNEGSMSWLERLNLSMSGYSEEDLASMSNWNKDALHELNMITSSSQNGMDLNDVKLKYADVLSTIHEQNATSRLALLQPLLSETKSKLKFNPNSEFVSYTLTHSHMGYKSIPITLVETAHSRHIDLDDEQLLSTLEKQRAKVIRADIELSRYADVRSEGRKARMDVFKEEVEALDNLTKRAAQGDNNIVKSALRGIMPNSEIQIARSLGGQFGAYATKWSGREGIATIAAFNTNSVLKIAKGYGIAEEDLIYKEEGDHFGRILYKKDGKEHQLRALMTREPAQGPGSSLLVDVMLHHQLPKDYAYVGLPQLIRGGELAKNAQAIFGFGDYDADTYKTSSLGPKISAERIQQLRTQQNTYLKSFKDLADFANKISLKGSSQDMIRVDDLANYEKNATQSSAKGIQRKMIAPEATDIATKMAESLDLHLNALKGTLTPEQFAKRQFTARMAIHNLVENLLKTQHGKTDKVGVASLPMQQLSHQLKDINKNDQFKTIASQILDDALGFNMNKDTTSPEVKAMYKQAKTDIIDAVHSYGHAVDAREGSLATNRVALHKGIQEFTKSIQGLASNGLLPGMEHGGKEANFQSVMNKGRNMIEYVKNTAANNKKTLGIAGLALGAVAATMGSESVDLSKDSLPLKTSDAILPPIPTEKGYITKGRDYRKQQSHTVRGSATKPINRESVDRNIFNGKPKANITINDKRNQDIRNLQ